MTTLTCNRYLQMMTNTDDDRNSPFELQEIRELCPNEIQFVSGGFFESALEGFVIGGMLGGIIGAAVTGSSAGFTSFGAFGAAIGGSLGFGWGLGTYLVKNFHLH